MADSLSFEQVWQLFLETNKKFQETEKMFQETTKKFQETDKKFQETDKKFQQLEKFIEELGKKIDQFLQKRQEEQKQPSEYYQEVWKTLDNLSKRLGDLGNRLGEFVEEMVQPSLPELFRERGLEIRAVLRGIKGEWEGKHFEIDLLAVDDWEGVAVECKSRLTVDAVERHVWRLSVFKKALPLFSKLEVYGAVAGMVIDEDAKAAAMREGLFVLEQSGKYLRIANPLEFQARKF